MFHKWLLLPMVAIVTVLFSFRMYDPPTIVPLTFPDYWPKPLYDFQQYPVTEKGFQLGRRLFYDPILSLDSTISCSSCHLQSTGFTHVDHRLSHGIDGKKGLRNAPSIVNLAWNNSFHWDGGVTQLRAQALNPIQHPSELGNTLEHVLDKLNDTPHYRKWFQHAFQDSVITTEPLLSALTQYVVSLVSANSKYDQYRRGTYAMSPQEMNGLKLFDQHCNRCHTAPLFNSNSYASNGLPLDPSLNDLGRFLITRNPADSLKFRIPTLRNAIRTFPYMHDGRFQRLSEVIDYYCDDIDRNSPQLDERLRHPIELSANERKDLLAFLHTLTDHEFLFNPRFRYPRDFFSN